MSRFPLTLSKECRVVGVQKIPCNWGPGPTQILNTSFFFLFPRRQKLGAPKAILILRKATNIHPRTKSYRLLCLLRNCKQQAYSFQPSPSGEIINYRMSYIIKPIMPEEDKVWMPKVANGSPHPMSNAVLSTAQNHWWCCWGLYWPNWVVTSYPTNENLCVM